MVLAGAGERQPVADAAQRSDLSRRWREMAPYLDRYGEVCVMRLRPAGSRLRCSSDR